MAIERVFLGWDGPCLPKAVAWLRQRVPADASRVWDLSGWLLVLPGGRAVRRMQELLAAEAESSQLLQWPPELTTQGALADDLFEPSGPVVSDLASQLLWAQVLRQADEADVLALVPRAQDRGDLPAWLGAAEELVEVVNALAGEGLTPDQVLPRLEARTWVDFPDARRWEALARLHARYEAALNARGWLDPHAARREALTSRRCRCDRNLLLIGCVDLPGITSAMLRQLTTPVVSLVHAPESEREGFDELGVLRRDVWADREVTLNESCWHVAKAPRDQRELVLRLLEREGASYAPDQITVGLGDEVEAGPLQRMLSLAGVASRPAVGPALLHTAPMQLLTALGRFIGSRRFDDLAALLRHPDMEAYVGPAKGYGSWLNLLDRYANDHLQQRVTPDWLGEEPVRRSMKRVYDAVLDLLPHDPQERRPLSAWAGPLAEALIRVYDPHVLRRQSPRDRLVIESLQLIGRLLRELAEVDKASRDLPAVTVAEAVRIVASRASGSALPEPGGEPAIELLGWLELAMDDAPLLIVGGFNEGLIPASRGSDPWLPDSTRTALGLPDDRARLARDTFFLCTLLESKRVLHLITCRTTRDGDPIPPSRLLLACDAATRARRLMKLYEDDPADDGEAPLLLWPAGQGRFVIPRPASDLPRINRLNVTAFADYLTCPYRFYLRHVLKLQAQDDNVRELAGHAFGDLAHGVLAEFGRDPVAGTSSTEDLKRRLDALLDDHIHRQFGASPAATVLLQARVLRDRLHAWAHWQVQQVLDGWQILHVEHRLECEVSVDGEPFTLYGQIDRIDQHLSDGRIRVLDYKTSEKPLTPDQAHREENDGSLKWVSLQLPLYRLLVEPLGLGSRIELGYVNLPHSPGRIGLSPAEWTPEDLSEAEAVAHEVIRKIRRGVFWPPAAPRYEDDYSGICLDGTLDGAEFRRGLQEASS